MRGVKKEKKVKGYDVEKELREIDRLFAELERDKSLPTFADFFVTCLILGIAERVNLKTMYPTMYAKLTREIARHDEKIRAKQRLQVQGK